MIMRRAFTLVELIVVIGVIALLMAIGLGLSVAGIGLSRRAVCATKLRQIYATFEVHAQGLARTPVFRPFPGGYAWPNIPYNVVRHTKLFVCPEEPDVKEVIAPVYELYTSADDLLIPFAPLEGSCRVTDYGNYTEYRFESGGGVVDYNDVVFHVSNTVPPVATLSPDEWSFRGVGTMSLYRNGEVVPGWEDFRDVPAGEEFIMEGTGKTSYGINAEAENVRIDQFKIVVLDYDRTVANSGEDIAASLAAGARHLGRLNVLFSTGVVRACTPGELDPIARSELWWP